MYVVDWFYLGGWWDCDRLWLGERMGICLLNTPIDEYPVDSSPANVKVGDVREGSAREKDRESERVERAFGSERRRERRGEEWRGGGGTARDRGSEEMEGQPVEPSVTRGPSSWCWAEMGKRNTP